MTDREYELEDCLIDMCYQFAHKGISDGKACLSSMGLSTLEDAFIVLGWNDPNFDIPEECLCEVKECQRWMKGWVSDEVGHYRVCDVHEKDWVGREIK